MSSGNCYEYATDKFSHDGPGDIKLYYSDPKNNLNCESLIKNITYDGHRRIDCSRSCKYFEYKIMAFVAPGNDFHFYRQEDDGTWSQKFRNQHKTNLDASGKIIKDPMLADRYYNNYLNYSEQCGCFCINKYRR